MSRVRNALKLSFLSQYTSLGIQFVTSIAIARLLLPEEVGIYSISAGLVMIAQILRDFGTGQYLIQENELTTDRIRAAFSVTLLTGWTLALIVFIASQFAADFYNQEGIQKILRLLSINFLLLPFGTITAAYIRREMNFAPIAIANISSAFAGSVVSISCALYGLSYMSMAWGGIASSIITIIAINSFRPSGLPLLPGIKEVPHVISFGTKFSLVEILNHVGSTVPELILGKTLGMESAGLMSRTQGLMRMFGTILLRGVAPVINPYFSEKHRSKQDLRQPYIFGVTCITGLAWPFFATLAIIAPNLVIVLYGEHWRAVIPLVQIWCIGMIPHPLNSLIDTVLAATGRVNALLRLSMTINFLNILIPGAAAFISLKAVIIGFTFVNFLRFLIIWKLIHHSTGIMTKDYVSIIARSSPLAIAAGASGLIATTIIAPFYDLSATFTLLLSIILSGASWLITLLIIDHPLKHELIRTMNRRAASDRSP